MINSEIIPPAEVADTIVLLSVDSLRLDRVHAKRNGEPLTPNIDSLADDGLEFAEGISPGPGTADSVPAMMTGEYPSQFSGFSLPPARTAPLTLAEQLGDHGFTSAAFNQNNLLSRRYNFDRGFDSYYDISEETRREAGRATWRLRVRSLLEDTPLMSVGRAVQTFLMENFGKSLYVLDEQGDSLTDRAMKFLDTTEGRRFLWIHYMDTHHPYLSSEGVMDRFGRRLPVEKILKLSRKARTDGDNLTDKEIADLEYAYDCSVRFVDEQVGRVIEGLADEGELENSLIIVTADHGEEFMEHGAFGHRDALWDELIRVPLIVRYPPIGDVNVDGQAPVRSLVKSVVHGGGWFNHLNKGYDYVVAETQTGSEGIRCARGNGYKLIIDGDERTTTKLEDGDESIVDEAEVPEGVLASFEKRLAETYDSHEPDPLGDEQALREDLKALGYLDE